MSQEEGRTSGYHFWLDTWPGRRSATRYPRNVMGYVHVHPVRCTSTICVHCLEEILCFVLLSLLLSKILKTIKPRIKHHCPFIQLCLLIPGPITVWAPPTDQLLLVVVLVTTPPLPETQPLLHCSSVKE